MRTVLYTEDLQPIAIVELTPNEEEIIKSWGTLRIPIRRPFNLTNKKAPQYDEPEYMELRGEPVKRDNARTFILFIRGNLVPKLQGAFSIQDLKP